MRKLLLASAAALGAFLGIAGPASAQLVTFSENPSAPMPPPTKWSRSGAFGFVQNTEPIPAPGTAVVRVSGFIAEYMGVTGGLSQMYSTGSGRIGGNKVGNPDFFGYIRLYPSLEGVAANGLKYGAFAEIRQDSGIAPTGAGGGAVGSISGQGSHRAELYWRRAFIYFGTDQFGTFRLGSGDQPTSLFMTGTTENFDDGGWNGDVPAIVGNLGPAWPFEDQGSLYTTMKAVYLSPQFFGFDFGVSYEPNTGNLNGNSLNCASGFASVGCDNLSSFGSVPGTDETSRRRNTFDGVLRWRGSFGVVGLALTAGGIESGHVSNSDTPPFTGSFRRTGLSVGDFGGQVTIGGLALQAHAVVGTFNPANGFNQVPFKGEGRGVAWTAGASYTMGPLVFGAQYFTDTGAGNQTPANALIGVGKLRDTGIAAGATYSVTPGFGFFASYIYGHRKEGGWDFVDGRPDPFLHNRVHVQAAALGTYVKW